MHVEGRGLPLLVIPGIQGRWEWMRPGIRALATRFRVTTYSLAGEPEDVLPTSASFITPPLPKNRKVGQPPTR